MPKFYSDVVLNDGALQAKTNGQTDLGTSSVKLKNAFFAGEVSATQGFTGDLTGNADTATTLATARNINGVSFNGSANITVPILGEANQEITGNREVDLADNSLSFKNGNANIMVLQDGLVTISEPVLFTNSNGYTVGEIRLKEAPAASGDEYVGFKANGSLSASTVWELPAADGSNGQVLSTNGSAVLSWATAGGGTTTATPTATFGATGQQGATLTGTIDNHIPSASYLLKVFNSSGAFQNIYGSVDSSGNISVTAPTTIATGYELRISCADVGELASNVLAKTFAVTQATSFTVWRLQGVDSNGNNHKANTALGEMELYPTQNAGGTHEPNGNATSPTSISGVTLSSGYQYSSTYALWEAFDGTINGISSAWWTIGNNVPNDNWIQVRFASGAQTFQSVKLTVVDNFHVATHFKLLGSNDGTNFVTVIDTTAYVESGSATTTTTYNF
jgi:hypothetical protein